jgi:thioredoxin-like negative regulator of GroEL
MKAEAAFREKGDFKRALAAYEALPSSMRDDIWMTIQRCFYAMCDRDFKAAHEVVSKSPNEEIAFIGAIVPKRVADIWLELVQVNHPTTREQLNRKVEADPTNPFLVCALAFVDVALGRKEEAIWESRHALSMRPISEDQVDGAWLLWESYNRKLWMIG